MYERLKQNAEQQKHQDKKQSIKKQINNLTSREREILSSIIQEKTNRITAQDLGISINTVEIHRIIYAGMDYEKLIGKD